MYDITMPRLSDSMEEGKIIRWRVAVGQDVREGDVLAEIESDKAVMELECFRDGQVAEILRREGDEVRVGEVIARLTLKGDVGRTAAGAAANAKPASSSGVLPRTAPAGQASAQPAVPSSKPEQPASPPPEPAPSHGAQPAAARPTRRIAISPYARKLAEARGVDYTRLTGSGEGGRIMARDVEAAARGAQQPVAAASPAAADEELPPLELLEGEADVEDAPFRLKTVARRVVAAKHVVPHFYVTSSADVTRLVERRAVLKETLGATVTHLVLLACLKAIDRHPQVNRSWDHGRIIRWKGVHLGLAVQTDEGLTVAVLRDAQRLSLAQIVERAKALAERARQGRLSADERRHPTFTVSNLGMFDVESFSPILNPPSSITLAVASALDAPVVRQGGIYVGKVMKLTASCDHRILDGASVAAFLRDLKAFLEDPDLLLEGAL